MRYERTLKVLRNVAPREYLNSDGEIVLHYVEAIQECFSEHLCVVRDGQLQIFFLQTLRLVRT